MSHKLTSLFVIISFSIVNVFSFSSPTYASTHKNSAENNFLTGTHFPAGISLPTELGTVETFFKGNSPETVVIVQDAHAIPGAQKSIRKVVEHFEKQYGTKLVALEGAAGKLDPTFFSSFPDPQILNRVFDNYLESGELSGAATASVFGSGKTNFYGVENAALYEEGVTDFLAALDDQPENLERIHGLRAQWNTLKEKYYSRELAEFDQKLEALDQKEAKWVEFLIYLEKSLPAKDFSKRISQYPHLKIILETVKNDSPAYSEALREEILEFSEIIRKKIQDKKTLRKFQGELQDFKTERIDPESFAAFLAKISSEQNLSIAFSPEMKMLISRHDSLKNLKAAEFFQEFQTFVDETKTRLFQKPEEKELDRIHHRISLLEKFVRLELSRSEWNELKKNFSGRMMPPHLASPSRGEGRVEVDSQILNLEKAVSEQFSFLKSEQTNFFQFYENAEKREEAMHKNLAALVKNSKSKNAEPVILVAGGFHADGFRRLFEKEKISYVLVSPAMKQIPAKTHYLDYMRGEVSWRNYFKIKNDRVDLNDAFSRATMDRLLNAEKNPATVKLWRDQIIRNLNEQNRIADAGEYTRYIDQAALKSAAPEKLEALRKEWIAKVEHLVSGLRLLKNENRLTVQNLTQFMQQRAITHPASVMVFVPHATAPADFSRPELRGTAKAKPTAKFDPLIFGDQIKIGAEKTMGGRAIPTDIQKYLKTFFRLDRASLAKKLENLLTAKTKNPETLEKRSQVYIGVLAVIDFLEFPEEFKTQIRASAEKFFLSFPSTEVFRFYRDRIQEHRGERLLTSTGEMVLAGLEKTLVTRVARNAIEFNKAQVKGINPQNLPAELIATGRRAAEEAFARRKSESDEEFRIMMMRHVAPAIHDELKTHYFSTAETGMVLPSASPMRPELRTNFAAKRKKEIATAKLIYRDLLAANIELMSAATALKASDEATAKDRYASVKTNLEELRNGIILKNGVFQRQNFRKDVLDRVETALRLIDEANSSAANAVLSGVVEVAGKEYVRLITPDVSAPERKRIQTPQIVWRDPKTAKIFIRQSAFHKIQIGARDIPFSSFEVREFTTLWEAFRSVDHQIDTELSYFVETKKAVEALRKIYAKLDGIWNSKTTTLPVVTAEAQEKILNELQTAVSESSATWIIEKELAELGIANATYQIKMENWFRALSIVALTKNLLEKRLIAIESIIRRIEEGRLRELRRILEDLDLELKRRVGTMQAALKKNHQDIFQTKGAEILELLRNNREPDLRGIRGYVLRATQISDSGKRQEYLNWVGRKIEAAGNLHLWMRDYRAAVKRLRLQGIEPDIASRLAFHQTFQSFVKRKNILRGSVDDRLWWLRFYQAIYVPLAIYHPAEVKKRISNPLFRAFSILIELDEMDSLEDILKTKFSGQSSSLSLRTLLEKLSHEKKRISSLNRNEKLQIVDAVIKDVSTSEISVTREQILAASEFRMPRRSELRQWGEKVKPFWSREIVTMDALEKRRITYAALKPDAAEKLSPQTIAKLEEIKESDRLAHLGYGFLLRTEMSDLREWTKADLIFAVLREKGLRLIYVGEPTALDAATFYKASLDNPEKRGVYEIAKKYFAQPDKKIMPIIYNFDGDAIGAVRSTQGHWSGRDANTLRNILGVQYLDENLKPATADAKPRFDLNSLHASDSPENVLADILNSISPEVLTKIFPGALRRSELRTRTEATSGLSTRNQRAIFYSHREPTAHLREQLLKALVPQSIVNVEGEQDFRIVLGDGHFQITTIHRQNFSVDINLSVDPQDETNLWLNNGHIHGDIIPEFGEVRANYLDYPNPFFAWWYQTRLEPFAKALGFNSLQIEVNPIKTETLEKLGFAKLNLSDGVHYRKSNINVLAQPSAAIPLRAELRHSWIQKKNLTRVQNRTIISRQMEMGLHEGLLDFIAEKYGEETTDQVAQSSLTGGLGALTHDLFPAWKANGIDVIGINPIYEKIKEHPPRELVLGKYVREAILATGGQIVAQFPVTLTITDAFRARAQWSKAKTILDKKIFIRTLRTETKHYGAPQYYLDAYYLKDERIADTDANDSNRVRIFDEVYSDDFLWRDIHMAIYRQASEQLTNILQSDQTDERFRIKKQILTVDNEVFVSLPPLKNRQNGGFRNHEVVRKHINHSVFLPTIYPPDEVSYELLGFPEWMRPYIVKDGKISITDYVALSYHFFVGVSLDEHTPVLEKDIFHTASHRLKGYQDAEGVRSTNGVLVEYWQSPERQTLIQQYRQKLGLTAEATDQEFFDMIRKSDKLDEFKRRNEFISAANTAKLLIWLKAEQDPENRFRWLEKTFQKWTAQEFSGRPQPSTDPVQVVTQFHKAVSAAVFSENESEREEKWSELFRQNQNLKNVLLEDPIVSNVRRQVPYKGPDKWIEILESLAGHPDLLAEFKKNVGRLLIGGRVFDGKYDGRGKLIGGALFKFQRLKELIKILELEDHIMPIENYNIRKAPIIFRGDNGTVMLSDKGLEASSTSPGKAVTEEGVLIGVWGGFMSELFRIVDRQGNAIDIFERKISYDEVRKSLASGEWKITNGYLVEYADNEKSDQPGGGWRPSAQSLKQALFDMKEDFQNETKRRDLQFEALATTPKVNMREGQARAHAYLWEAAIKEQEQEDELFGKLQFSMSDAQKIFQKDAKTFHWWRDSQHLEESGPGLLGFVETFRSIATWGSGPERGKIARDSLLYHAGRGNIFVYLKDMLKNLSESSAPIREKIQEYANAAARETDKTKISKLELQAIDLVDRFTFWLSAQVFEAYIKTSSTAEAQAMEKILANPLVRESISRYLDGHPSATTFVTNERGLRAFGFDLHGKHLVIALNTGAISSPDPSTGKWKARGRIIYNPSFESILDREKINGNVIYKAHDVKLQLNYGLYDPLELKNGLRIGIPDPEGIQVLELIPQEGEAVSLLTAVVGRRTVSVPYSIQTLVQRIKNILKENGASGVADFLSGVASQNAKSAEDLFTRERIPAVMALIAGLAPTLLERMHEWDPNTYAVLRTVISDNQDLFDRGEIAFHDPSRSSTVVFSRSIDGGDDGKNVVLAIQFEFDPISHMDERIGKVWVTIGHLGTDQQPLKLARVATYQVRDLVTGRLYEKEHSGAELLNAWHVGVPVRNRDSGENLPGFQVLKILKSTAARSELRESNEEQEIAHSFIPIDEIITGVKRVETNVLKPGNGTHDFYETKLDLLHPTSFAAQRVIGWRHNLGSRNSFAKDQADGTAAYWIRKYYNQIPWLKGEVVIGEGERDEAPMLFIGEHVGAGFSTFTEKPNTAIAMDVVELTNGLVKDAIQASVSIAAYAEYGTLTKAPDIYISKWVVGPQAKGSGISVEKSTEENLKAIAAKLGKNISELKGALLFRPAHTQRVIELLNAGISIGEDENAQLLRQLQRAQNETDLKAAFKTLDKKTKEKGIFKIGNLYLLADGDLTPTFGLLTGKIDFLTGRGGAPEGVIVATLVKAIGGEMSARFVSADALKEANLNADLDRDGARFSDAEIERLKNFGFAMPGEETAEKKSWRHVYTADELVPSNDFAVIAAGIKENPWIPGLHAPHFDSQTGEMITYNVRATSSGNISVFKITYETVVSQLNNHLDLQQVRSSDDWYKLGLAYLAYQEFDRAIHAFSSAKQFDGPRENFYEAAKQYALAIKTLILGKDPETGNDTTEIYKIAAEYLEKSVSLSHEMRDPRLRSKEILLELYEFLGDQAADAGNNPLAIDYYTKVLRRNSENKGVHQKLEEMQKLNGRSELRMTPEILGVGVGAIVGVAAAVAIAVQSHRNRLKVIYEQEDNKSPKEKRGAIQQQRVENQFLEFVIGFSLISGLLGAVAGWFLVVGIHKWVSPKNSAPVGKQPVEQKLPVTVPSGKTNSVAQSNSRASARRSEALTRAELRAPKPRPVLVDRDDFQTHLPIIFANIAVLSVAIQTYRENLHGSEKKNGEYGKLLIMYEELESMILDWQSMQHADEAFAEIEKQQIADVKTKLGMVEQQLFELSSAKNPIKNDTVSTRFKKHNVDYQNSEVQRLMRELREQMLGEESHHLLDQHRFQELYLYRRNAYIFLMNIPERRPGKKFFGFNRQREVLQRLYPLAIGSPWLTEQEERSAVQKTAAAYLDSFHKENAREAIKELQRLFNKLPKYDAEGIPELNDYLHNENGVIPQLFEENGIYDIHLQREVLERLIAHISDSRAELRIDPIVITGQDETAISWTTSYERLSIQSIASLVPALQKVKPGDMQKLGGKEVVAIINAPNGISYLVDLKTVRRFVEMQRPVIGVSRWNYQLMPNEIVITDSQGEEVGRSNNALLREFFEVELHGILMAAIIKFLEGTPSIQIAQLLALPRHFAVNFQKEKIEMDYLGLRQFEINRKDGKIIAIPPISIPEASKKLYYLITAFAFVHSLQELNNEKEKPILALPAPKDFLQDLSNLRSELRPARLGLGAELRETVTPALEALAAGKITDGILRRLISAVNEFGAEPIALAIESTAPQFSAAYAERILSGSDQIVDLSRWDAKVQEILPALRAHIRAHLSANASNQFHFNAVLPLENGILDLLAGILQEIQIAALKSENKNRVSAEIILLAPSPYPSPASGRGNSGQNLFNQIPSPSGLPAARLPSVGQGQAGRGLGEGTLQALLQTGMVKILAINDPATTREVNNFLALPDHQNALAYALPDSLDRQIARQKQVVSLEGLSWREAFLPATLIGFKAAEVPEITAALLQRIPEFFPEGSVGYNGVGLVLYEAARNFILEASVSRLIETMA